MGRGLELTYLETVSYWDSGGPGVTRYVTFMLTGARLYRRFSLTSSTASLNFDSRITYEHPAISKRMECG